MIDGKEIVKAMLSTIGGTESNTPHENFRVLCELTGYTGYQELPEDMTEAWLNLDVFLYNKLLRAEQ